jgi:hypothetical protein
MRQRCFLQNIAQSKDTHMPSGNWKQRRAGTQGWRQFLTAKKTMLAAYDSARTHARAHEVETYHGKVAEAEFRKWLTTFLPKKYGVTAGYIISQGFDDSIKAPHYYVIIYEQLESPVLWVEEYPDASIHGSSRAVPAEHVRAVMEVKSNLNSKSAYNASKHLCDLEPLLAGIDKSNELYKKFLPANFFCFSIFFNLLKADEYSNAAIVNTLAANKIRGYMGAEILRGEGLLEEVSGRILPLINDTPTPTSCFADNEKLSLMKGGQISNPNSADNEKQRGAFLMWAEAMFSMFAFDLIALLNGNYKLAHVHSMHGMSWLTSQVEEC